MRPPDGPRGSHRYDPGMGFVALVLALVLEQFRPLPRDNPVHALSASVADAIAASTDAGQRHHGLDQREAERQRQGEMTKFDEHPCTRGRATI